MNRRGILIVAGAWIAFGLLLAPPVQGHEPVAASRIVHVGVNGPSNDPVLGSTTASSLISDIPNPLQRAFFVSPAGDDGNDGGISSPFKTLKKAQQAMRASAVKTTYLRGGMYHLSETLILSQLDSGQAWINYPSEKPIISGGEVITGFREEAGTGRFSAPISFNPGLDVTLNGIRQRPAQTGSWSPQEVLHDTGFLFLDQGPNLNTTFKFRGDDLTPADWMPGIFAETFHAMRYGSRISSVTGIDFASRIVTLGAPASVNALTNGSTYRLLGNPRWIKNRGEFGYDSARARLVLYPHDPTTLTVAGAVVAKLPTLLRVEGASNIDLVGLTLSDTVYNNGSRNMAALVINRSLNIRVGGNRFRNVGRAIEVFGGEGHRIAGNEIAYVESGISIEEAFGSSVPNDIRIYANSIHDTAMTGDKGGGAITIAQGGTNVRIAYNHIQDVGRAGINWWTDGRPNVSNFTIEFNKIVRAQRATGDNGSIYGFVNHSTHNHHSVIRHNWIDDTGGITNHSYWAPARNRLYQWVYNGLTHGIYLDDSVSGVEVYGNFVKGGSAGVMIHGGRDNVVTNNFFIVRGTGPVITGLSMAASRKTVNATVQNTVPIANTYSKNISFSPMPTMKPHIDGPANEMTADLNVIHNLIRRSGVDVNSLVAAPLFKDPAAGDYSLKPASPALALGIKDLLWNRMGLQGFSPDETYPKFWQASALDTGSIPAGPFNVVLQQNLPP